MRKTIVFLGILLAFSSCEKDCEKDHTATLEVSNAADEPIYIEIYQENDVVIEPGHKKSIEVDLNISGTSELLYQSVITFSRESTKDVSETKGVIYNQCETTKIAIE